MVVGYCEILVRIRFKYVSNNICFVGAWGIDFTCVVINVWIFWKGFNIFLIIEKIQMDIWNYFNYVCPYGCLRIQLSLSHVYLEGVVTDDHG